MNVHENFRELAAISTCGCLTADERSSLEAHLAVCPECREAADDYEVVAATGMPSLAPDFSAAQPEIPAEWSIETAKREFFRRLEAEKAETEKESLWNKCVKSIVSPKPGWRFGPGAPQGLLPYAVAVSLLVIAGVVGFRLGTQSADRTQITQPPVQAITTSGEQDEIASITRERETLSAQLEQRDRAIVALNNKITHQLEEIQGLKSDVKEMSAASRTAREAENQTASERDGLNHKLQEAQAQLASAQTDMESLRQQRADDSRRMAELEVQSGKFPELLRDRDATIDEQRELLARDRDIRDLMGARDLYVAEVIDVGSNGETKKPFGRVFYTKGKSLIFYAFDLDQQPGLREASTFQAWGRRGPDMARATNMGIFYMDNTSHKRWVLKFNDAKSLEQIDAVFVTVEPKGGSRKPSGKQLLLAYLKVQPNHP